MTPETALPIPQQVFSVWMGDVCTSCLLDDQVSIVSATFRTRTSLPNALHVTSIRVLLLVFACLEDSSVHECAENPSKYSGCCQQHVQHTLLVTRLEPLNSPNIATNLSPSIKLQLMLVDFRWATLIALSVLWW